MDSRAAGEEVGLTPVSPEREMVREQMPLQASQNRISWSYEPVTRMTDMSWRVAGEVLLAAAAMVRAE